MRNYTMTASTRDAREAPQRTVGDVGASLLLLAVFASSWTGVFVGVVQLSDGLLLLAVLFVLWDATAANRALHLPGSVWWASAVVLLLVLSHAVAPTDPHYLLLRYGGLGTKSGITVGLQWLVALFVLVAVTQLLPDLHRWIPRLLVAWLLGITLSAAVGITDGLGLTSISRSFIGDTADYFGRQAGLTAQANSLAVSGALAVPIALWFWKSRHVLGGLVLLVLTGGVFLSGSRGGQAAFLAAVFATGLFVSGARKLLVAGLAVLAAAGVAFYRQVGDQVDTYLRFDTGQGVVQSNAGRGTRATQAIADFWHRPFDGIGLPFLLQAHNVYLQVIAAGGLILLLVLAAYFTSALRVARRVGRSGEPLGYYLAVSIATWLAVGVVENQLVDRWLYIPLASAIALGACASPTPSRPAASG